MYGKNPYMYGAGILHEEAAQFIRSYCVPLRRYACGLIFAGFIKGKLSLLQLLEQQPGFLF